MPRPRSQPPNKERVQLAFGAKVRARREQLLLTQDQLAERAQLHTNYVSSVERGERNLGLHNVARLAYGLELGIGELVAGVDER